MEDERSTEYPRYEHYQIGQGYTERPEIPAGGRQKKKIPFVKKLGVAIVLGAVFGTVAGGAFFGILRLTGVVPYRESSAELERTERVEINDAIAESNTEGGAASQKGSVAEVAQASMPAVVAITTVSVQEIPSFFGYGIRRYQSEGSGSGIIVQENDTELLIATNNHVVDGATTVSVCFMGNEENDDGEDKGDILSGDGDLNVKDAVSAKIKGTDAENDLAVLAVLKSDIPQDTMDQIKIAQIGNSDSLVVGEQVVAIGNALGYGQSVTSGWVSALDRSVSVDEGISTGLIQTDAAINPGNSGGALLNMNGELIGINSVKYADNAVEGMGYAIPISRALPILEKMMTRKTREKVDESRAGSLGIHVVHTQEEIRKMYGMPQGVFVDAVYDGGAADKAGLMGGDIIAEFDGQKIVDTYDLSEKLQYYAAGEQVEVTVFRSYNGSYEETVVNVTLDPVTVR